MPLCTIKKVRRKIPLLNQKGQTFVEFVLLLAVVMIISVGMLSTMNSNLGEYWHAMAKKIVDDPNETFELR